MMNPTSLKITELEKMAEKYRKIRLSQPSLSSAEMRAQLLRNRLSEGNAPPVASSQPS